ncbi:alpha/beta fold hydrolase [Jatrophihabitans endophyticus]|nr:alpha/beta fold hydrolase [Jatrophihabitans endophyticus]
MTAVGAPRLDLTSDHVPVRGARAGELRAYGRMVRMVGRGVPQPPAGLGTPTLLVPGFLSGDVSLTLLSRELRRRGHRTFRSDIGANVGCTEPMVRRLLDRLEVVAAAEGGPVTLVGHSRGGMVVALAARRRPDLVAGVVALSAPVTGSLSVAPHVRRQLELLFRLNRRGLTRVLGADCVTGDCALRVAAELTSPFPAAVPFTSVYSRDDAIIDWRTCLDPAAELVEVRSGHVGMATDPAVVRIVARQLAAIATTG